MYSYVMVKRDDVGGGEANIPCQVLSIVCVQKQIAKHTQPPENLVVLFPFKKIVPPGGSSLYPYPCYTLRIQSDIFITPFNKIVAPLCAIPKIIKTNSIARVDPSVVYIIPLERIRHPTNSEVLINKMFLLSRNDNNPSDNLFVTEERINEWALRMDYISEKVQAASMTREPKKRAKKKSGEREVKGGTEEKWEEKADEFGSDSESEHEQDDENDEE